MSMQKDMLIMERLIYLKMDSLYAVSIQKDMITMV